MILHPGVIAAIKMLTADELTIARLMASGDLLSPQRYYNVTLFNLRITGTGFSYRPTLNEYVFRKPENYLTPDFLARCNGLPVIWQHPKTAMLNSQEYSDRNVGSVMLPYIKGDDVWAIVKIYDDEAIALLNEDKMSTSPAVLLDKGTRIVDENGDELLIEGKAKLLDHIAICPNGVWDKGGDPTGIDQSNIRGDSIMAEEKKEDVKKDSPLDNEKKSESRMDEKFDLLLKGIDALRADMASCNSRMDAFEKFEKEDKKEDKKDAKKDASDEEDKEKKDASEEDPEETSAKRLAADKAKKDSKRKDSDEESRMDAAELSALRKTMEEQQRTIANLAQLVRQPIPEMDRAALAGIQSRADSVMIQLGERAQQPLVGESPIAYRRRMAAAIQKHSDRWKKVKLETLDDAVFQDVAEGQIYADAAERAKSPNDIGPGRMREVTRPDGAGHYITEFFGNDASIVQQFSRPTRRARVREMGSIARQ